MVLERFKKSERGSITVFVLSTMLLIVGIVFIFYFSMMNKSNSQAAELNKIQEEYNQSADAMNQVYYENEPFGSGQIAQKNETYKDDDGDIAIIPAGFEIVPGLDDISEGLVISDNSNDTEIEGQETVAEGNQFVWVPVTNFSEFKRHDFGIQGISDSSFISTELTSELYYEPAGDGVANGTEAEKMYNSVRDNKGFYIGRYEAGTETERNEESTIEDAVVSKKNKFVYNYIGWNNDGTMETETAEIGGAVEKARNFSSETNHTNVTSTLVYGVQWDAVMRWLSEGTEEEQGWLTDSTGKGNYYDNDDTNNPAKTGAVDTYQMKHIYDLAGNVWEWTMEAYSTARTLVRGAHYGDTGSVCPCSYRYNCAPDYSGPHIGFRLTLFL